MRAELMLAGLVLAGAAVAYTFAASEPASASGGSCLRFRDFTGMTLVDGNTAIARTRGSAKFKVTFQHACPDLKKSGNFYTVRPFSTMDCFDHDDVLEFRYGGVCFVQSVTPIAPAR